MDERLGPVVVEADMPAPPGTVYLCGVCQHRLEVRVVEDGRVLWCSGCQKVVGRSFPLRRA